MMSAHFLSQWQIMALFYFDFKFGWKHKSSISQLVCSKLYLTGFRETEAHESFVGIICRHQNFTWTEICKSSARIKQSRHVKQVGILGVFGSIWTVVEVSTDVNLCPPCVILPHIIKAAIAAIQPISGKVIVDVDFWPGVHLLRICSKPSSTIGAWI